MELINKIRNFPAQPGVYLMLDKSKKIIYIGKAVSIKNRVQSYFSSRLQDNKTRVLMSKVENVEYIVTENETEALILEDTLIKKHLPKYNILLKDDKHYPYLKITDHTEAYPRLLVTRERHNDQDLYFGPYANAGSIRKILQMLNRIFPLRKCTKKLLLRPWKERYLKPVGRICLNFQLNLCSAPCQGNIPPEEYHKTVDQAILFLRGENKKLLENLYEEMKQLSDNLQFEKARVIRDRIQTMESMMEEQKIIMNNNNSQDVVWITQKDEVFNITILFIREGKMTGKDNFILKNEIADIRTILNNFIKQFYLHAFLLPREIILPFEIEDKQLIIKVIEIQKKELLSIKTAGTGLEQKLLKMAEENSRLELSNYFMDWEYKNVNKQMKTLKEVLHLKRIPATIEGFDISNIQGNFSVGSMVRFTHGLPDKKQYRKFKIKTVEGIDDFKSIAEIVGRRYKRLKNEKQNFPDLILIDGGKQQLHFAQQALQQLQLNLPVISLAKQMEEIFFPEQEKPLRLPKNNPGLKLLQKVRDEAHRFAVTFHKDLRSKAMLK